jgi:hypothetical protein
VNEESRGKAELVSVGPYNPSWREDVLRYCGKVAGEAGTRVAIVFGHALGS